MTTSTNELASFTDLVDLASERLGGASIHCTDDFFAGMDNLVKAKEPVWDELAYTDRGKWMDGWESKRAHRENHLDADGSEHHDDCVVRLGAPGLVRGVVVDTAFFRGNFPSHCEIDGAVVDGYPAASAVAADARWLPLLPRSALAGNSKNAFAIVSDVRVTHVRLRIFPDGGVARLRVYGEPLPDWRVHGGLDGELDLASCELGGLVVACSDMFFGSRHNLLFPGPSGGMHDGWETRRSRRAGFDWAVVRLAARGAPRRVVVDTSHFKGNCPESFALEGCDRYDGERTVWRELVARVPLQPHTRHVFTPASGAAACSHVRLRVYPDGGVARFRLYGVLDEAERQAQRVRRLNAMAPDEASAALHTCCGSRAFAAHVAGARPFADHAALTRAVDAAFGALTETDWLEAFAAHPRIGGSAPAGHASAASQAQSANEQRGMDGADATLATRMADLNQQYAKKHGFIYIVKASGKSAAELLALLEERLGNDRATELGNAAAEQRKITALRLERIA